MRRWLEHGCVCCHAHHTSRLRAGLRLRGAWKGGKGCVAACLQRAPNSDTERWFISRCAGEERCELPVAGPHHTSNSRGARSLQGHQWDELILPLPLSQHPPHQMHVHVFQRCYHCRHLLQRLLCALGIGCQDQVWLPALLPNLQHTEVHSTGFSFIKFPLMRHQIFVVTSSAARHWKFWKGHFPLRHLDQGPQFWTDAPLELLVILMALCAEHLGNQSTST